MPEPNVVIERDVAVPMRDGTVLRADIYRPPGNGQHPVLLQRTPYNKANLKITSGLIFSAVEAVERGYSVIVQDSRGRFASEGEFRPYLDDIDDGYDTIEWITDQPWSDGRVGAYGSSYQGMTTWLAAVSGHPALVAIAPMLTGSGLIDGSLNRDAVFQLGERLRWTLFMISTEDDIAASPELKEALTNVDDVCWHLPLDAIPAVDAIEGAAFFDDWLTYPPEQGYGSHVDVVSRVEEIEVPVLHVTGWYDFLLPGFLAIYRAIEEWGHPTTRNHQYLVIGPWDHDAYLGNTPRMVGDASFGPDGQSGPAAFGPIAFEWFDHWLRGEDSLDLPRVRYFKLGEDRWIEAEAWPPAHEHTPLYLGSGGHANTRFGDGILTDAPVEGAPVDSFAYDPADPVPTVGGHVYMPQIVAGGVKDQAEVETREDVLVYSTPRLDVALSIAGPIGVRIHASSSAPDTDFTAKLVDVHPNGYCAIITEGIVRARFHNSTTEAKFIEPGEVYAYEIDLLSTAHKFETGHRIRLEVSSSNFPKFARNINTTTPPNRATAEEATVASQQVHHDEAHLSRVILPVVDEG